MRDEDGNIVKGGVTGFKQIGQLQDWLQLNKKNIVSIEFNGVIPLKELDAHVKDNFPGKVLDYDDKIESLLIRSKPSLT
jgi:hypothetical protein